jgi:hypothetical protein
MVSLNMLICKWRDDRGIGSDEGVFIHCIEAFMYTSFGQECLRCILNYPGQDRTNLNGSSTLLFVQPHLGGHFQHCIPCIYFPLCDPWSFTLAEIFFEKDSKRDLATKLLYKAIRRTGFAAGSLCQTPEVGRGSKEFFG